MKAYPYMHKHPTSGQTTESGGMDLRDWFAGLAMQALLGYEESTVQNDVEFAYQYADAMMKQREIKDVPNE
jgi:hypothetical protein